MRSTIAFSWILSTTWSVDHNTVGSAASNPDDCLHRPSASDATFGEPSGRHQHWDLHGAGDRAST